MQRAEDSTAAPGFENGKDGHFSATHWSIVLASGATDLTRATAALERLCRTYWFPIYAFIRRRGSDQPDAEDLTQDFFAYLRRKTHSRKWIDGKESSGHFFLRH